MKKFTSQTIKDFFFSRKCAVCGRIVEARGEYVCPQCLSVLRKKAALKQSGNYFYLFYYESDIKQIIAEMKLENRRYLSGTLADLCKAPLRALIEEKAVDVAIPVPVSRKRYWERGFNQVEELLRDMRITYATIEKIRDTKHMYELLDEEDRRKNIRDAFESRLTLTGKTVLLVDDIVTTGHTTEEIIKELQKDQRPKAVYVFSVALSKVFDKMRQREKTGDHEAKLL